jgi:hypothetical protein
VKAHPPRSEASKPNKGKAPVRPSGISLKQSAKAMPAKNGAVAKPVAAKTKPTKNGAAAKPLAVAKPAVVAKPVAKKANVAKPLAALVAVKAKAALKPVPVAKSPAKAVAAAKPTAPATTKATAAAKVAPPPIAIPLPKKPTRKSIKEAAGVSTDAVMRRTGKYWDDWFEVLDNAGAHNLDQRGIIAILAQKHGIGPWWQQMIAVGYESLRSKAEKPPAPDGFHINSSCTIDAPLPRVFRLWNDAGERARWLADDRFVVRGSGSDKVIRARWGKGTSHIAVSFAEKAGRTEVSVEHHQIESRAAAEQMKAYWAKKLGLLDQALAPRR